MLVILNLQQHYVHILSSLPSVLQNNLSELQLLIDKWRTVSQQALQDLHTEMPEPKPSLTQLINHLGIEHDLIDFDSEEEAFNS